ncbi:hypothetical protein [Geoglobus acetivorans]|uniref:DNA primase large subunit PriL n=1 Tax=Geoglobus acetivorans TaxID=565033 RepID=A0ABZ3H2B8_GEOAI|nr:hypothetical protein [Geoglobus acetivorans]
MKLLPILPYISDYPFLKPSKFLVEEIRKGVLFDYALEQAEEILAELLNSGKYEFSPEEKSFSCLTCEKPCRDVCTKYAMGEGIKWDRCDLCGECFRNCDFSADPQIYREYEAKAKLSVLSYLMMRSAVSGFGEATRRRFSTSLARAFRNAMEQDVSEVLPEIVASNFGIKMIRDEGLLVHVSDFLKASSRIKSPEWKLISRNLSTGYVEVKKSELYRIVEEHLRDLLFEPFPYDIEGIEALKRIVSEYELSRRGDDIKGVRDFESFPPCMKKILADLKASANVAHTARFALTTFMLQIGFSVDEILEIFKNAPDFDEEKARYQIEHIAGMRGAGKPYDVPSCSTMKTYLNCVAECRVNHPVEYYRRRVYENRRRKSEG